MFEIVLFYQALWAQAGGDGRAAVLGGTHEAFDEIADVAMRIGDKATVHKSLAENLRHCVACHAAYRAADGH